MIKYNAMGVMRKLTDSQPQPQPNLWQYNDLAYKYVKLGAHYIVINNYRQYVEPIRKVKNSAIVIMAA